MGHTWRAAVCPRWEVRRPAFWWTALPRTCCRTHAGPTKSRRRANVRRKPSPPLVWMSGPDPCRRRWTHRSTAPRDISLASMSGARRNLWHISEERFKYESPRQQRSTPRGHVEGVVGSRPRTCGITERPGLRPRCFLTTRNRACTWYAGSSLSATPVTTSLFHQHPGLALHVLVPHYLRQRPRLRRRQSMPHRRCSWTAHVAKIHRDRSHP